MAGNSGGPWGGGGSGGGDNRGGNGSNGRPPRGGDQQMPELDEIVRKGQEQLRVLMGGRGGRGGSGCTGGGDLPVSPRTIWALGLVAVIGLWLYNSVYTVRPEEQSVELFLGEFSSIGSPGLNFAPWPVVTAEVVNVTSERTENVGDIVANRVGGSSGLMLTTDANIVDIDFQVVWNINDPAKFLFNLRDGAATVRAVAESTMREIIARTELAPILNRDRGLIADGAREGIQ